MESEDAIELTFSHLDLCFTQRWHRVEPFLARQRMSGVWTKRLEQRRQHGRVSFTAPAERPAISASGPKAVDMMKMKKQSVGQEV